MIDRHKKGLQAELIAQEYFIKENYRVFPALHGIGPIDFIVLDVDNNVRFFDVKTNGKRSDGTKICRVNNKIPGIRIEIVYVDIDNKTVSVGDYDKYLWHKKYKIDKDNKGKYTGRIVKRI
ncbi:hypothetical protein N9Y58_01180 [Alphaproteobacteria bacterium]|nr:hypothetical protein [Alphaproteobacteria bacterium]